jgi:hypothetical protein
VDKMDEALTRLRRLECPAGELEKTVALVLEDYGVANMDDVKVSRYDGMNEDNTQAYRVDISGTEQSFMLLTRSGYDGYVSKVLDVYSTS